MATTRGKLPSARGGVAVARDVNLTVDAIGADSRLPWLLSIRVKSLADEPQGAHDASLGVHQQMAFGVEPQGAHDASLGVHQQMAFGVEGPWALWESANQLPRFLFALIAAVQVDEGADDDPRALRHVRMIRLSFEGRSRHLQGEFRLTRAKGSQPRGELWVVVQDVRMVRGIFALSRPFVLLVRLRRDSRAPGCCGVGIRGAFWDERGVQWTGRVPRGRRERSGCRLPLRRLVLGTEERNASRHHACAGDEQPSSFRHEHRVLAVVRQAPCGDSSRHRMACLGCSSIEAW